MVGFESFHVRRPQKRVRTEYYVLMFPSSRNTPSLSQDKSDCLRWKRLDRPLRRPRQQPWGLEGGMKRGRLVPGRAACLSWLP